MTKLSRSLAEQRLRLRVHPAIARRDDAAI
jgi:hypothetical protein